MQIEGTSTDGQGANPVLVTGTVTGVTNPATGQLTDRSGTITSGGDAQEVMAANPSRLAVFFQNLSDTDMYVSFTGTATAGPGSFLIPSGGGTFPPAGYVPTQALSVLCATTGKEFSAYEGS